MIKSGPCAADIHVRCEGCWCACHPVDFDHIVDEVFDELENDDGYSYHDERERIKEAHRAENL